jgi:hypothetical protein
MPIWRGSRRRRRPHRARRSTRRRAGARVRLTTWANPRIGPWKALQIAARSLKIARVFAESRAERPSADMVSRARRPQRKRAALARAALELATITTPRGSSRGRQRDQADPNQETKMTPTHREIADQRRGNNHPSLATLNGTRQAPKILPGRFHPAVRHGAVLGTSPSICLRWVSGCALRSASGAPRRS